MFDASRDYDQLSRVQPQILIPEFDKEPAFHDKKQFVLRLMVVPDKIPFQLNTLLLRNRSAFLFDYARAGGF